MAQLIEIALRVEEIRRATEAASPNSSDAGGRQPG
jgi:hypothetical protein